MDKYADSLPINARITVDYTKPNNDVRFEYPVNDRNIKKWVLSFIFPSIFLIWVFICIFIGMGYSIVTNLDTIYNLPETTFILSELLMSLFALALAFIAAFAPPILLSFYIGYNYSKFKYIFPKFQASISRFLSGGHFHTFVVDELKEPVFEIPLFKNVLLSYEASDDFSKYLRRVEVREHDFQYKGEKTQWLWKAKFIFSEIPKSGMLYGKFQ